MEPRPGPFLLFLVVSGTVAAVAAAVSSLLSRRFVVARQGFDLARVLPLDPRGLARSSSSSLTPV